MEARNPSLLQAVFEGGRPPEVDVCVSIDRKSIEGMILAAVLSAVIILFIKKHFF